MSLALLFGAAFGLAGFLLGFRRGHARGALDATRQHLRSTDSLLSRWRVEQRP